MKEIARRLEVPYGTIQWGFYQQEGPRPRVLTEPERRRLRVIWRSLERRGPVCREWREFGPFYRWAKMTGARIGRHLMRIGSRPAVLAAELRVGVQERGEPKAGAAAWTQRRLIGSPVGRRIQGPLTVRRTPPS